VQDFLQPGSPSCHPTNSVKVMKEYMGQVISITSSSYIIIIIIIINNHGLSARWCLTPSL